MDAPVPLVWATCGRAGGHGLCLHPVHALPGLQRHRAALEIRRRSRRPATSAPRHFRIHQPDRHSPCQGRDRDRLRLHLHAGGRFLCCAGAARRAGQPLVHSRSSTTGSSRAGTGTGARPMRWCCSRCAWPSCWSALRLARVNLDGCGQMTVSYKARAQRPPGRETTLASVAAEGDLAIYIVAVLRSTCSLPLRGDGGGDVQRKPANSQLITPWQGTTLEWFSANCGRDSGMWHLALDCRFIVSRGRRSCDLAARSAPRRRSC
jgi:hypothetical protein